MPRLLLDRRDTIASGGAARLTTLLALVLAFAALALAPGRASAAGCADGTLDGSFASAAQTGQIASAGEVDCYALSNVSAGDRVLIGLTSISGSAHWTLVDGSDATLCDSWFNASGCLLTDAGPYQLHVYSDSGTATFGYTVVARRLTDPQGCTPLGDPTVWSFTAGRLNGTLDDALAARCYTFTRALGEADGAYWFRAVRSAGTLQPRWRVVDPSGTIQCQNEAPGFSDCPLLASGQFAVVVDDAAGTQTGSFYLTAKRLSDPQGCAALPSVAFGAAPVSGSIATAGTIDCYSVPDVAPGDRVQVDFAGSGGSGRWALVDGSGAEVCEDTGRRDCALSGGGGYALLVFEPDGPGAFGYALAARRLTDPQGCSPLGDPAVWSFQGPRVDGQVAGALGESCYTFTRAVGEADGAYWWRSVRTAGDLQPQWRVLGPSGASQCNGTSIGYARCSLLASGQYAVVVEDQLGSQTGSFFLTAKRTTGRTGCTQLPSVAFGADPVDGTIATAGTVDCYDLPDVTAGDALEVGLAAGNGAARWTVLDQSGVAVCDSWFSSDCQLSGGSGWSLLVYDGGGDGTATFAYSLAVRRLTDPQGCSPLGAPAAWSFTASRVNGTIAGPLAARCYTFTRALGDADAAYWFQAVRSSGLLQPHWRVLDPAGTQQCQGTGPGFASCPLVASGQFEVVVEDQSNAQTGSFYLTGKRLTDPQGCSPLPSIAFGVPPVAGNLSAAGEIDCYTLPAAPGDLLSFHLGGSADQYEIVDDSGTSHCPSWASQCEVAGSGPYALLVYSSGTASGGYHFDASCDNVPCGQSETTVADVVPRRIGAGRYTTLLLRGRDLELLQSARLVLGGATIEGTPQQASADGRAIDVRFDLAGAQLGSWTLEAGFLDGTTRVVPDAVTVDPERPPGISIEMVGRDAFRPGQANTVTVNVTNNGNVDAIGVPVVLRGIPAGATIEPLFDMMGPTGSGNSPSLHKVAFDQSQETFQAADGIAAPVLIARVPAGRTVQMQYRITVPTMTTYNLRAYAGACLVTTAPGGAPGALAGSGLNSEGDPAANCLGSMFETAIDIADVLVPGTSCIAFGETVGTQLATSAEGGESFFSIPHLFSWAAGGLGCAADFTAVGKIYTAALSVASILGDGSSVVNNCFLTASDAQLAQRGVLSIDPNDIRGPSGVGDQHFVTGEVPFDYQILFENLASATAPAQRVEVTDQLDTASFDPASVLFQHVEFGSTVYALPYAGHDIDETLDLRPAQNLLVHVTAGVTAGGQIHWELQALDPDTLAPPSDPAVGFLPPNGNSPEGEGDVTFGVQPRTLASGTAVRQQASVRFDANAPIDTPVWSNTIDEQPPSAAVQADGLPDPASARIQWSGSDDAAGISTWEIEVSQDGGPFALWRTASSPGSDTFVANASGTYRFRAIARDGAGNVGQSAQAAVTLSTDGGPGQPPPRSTQPPVAGGAAPGGNAAAGGGGGVLSPAIVALRAGHRIVVRADRRLLLPALAQCRGDGPDCTARVTLQLARAGAKARALSVGTVHLAAGASARLRLTLTAAGWRLLARARGRALAVSAQIVVRRGTQSVRGRVSLTLAARAGSKRR